MKRQSYGKKYEREVGNGYSTIAVNEATYPIQAIYKNIKGESLFVKGWDSFGNIIMDLDYTLSTEITDLVVFSKVIIIDKIKNPNGNLPLELQ